MQKVTKLGFPEKRKRINFSKWLPYRSCTDVEIMLHPLQSSSAGDPKGITKERAWRPFRKMWVSWVWGWLPCGDSPHGVSPPLWSTQMLFTNISTKRWEAEGGEKNSGSFKFTWVAYKMEIVGWHGNVLFIPLNSSQPRDITYSSLTWMFPGRNN